MSDCNVRIQAFKCSVSIASILSIITNAIVVNFVWYSFKKKTKKKNIKMRQQLI